MARPDTDGERRRALARHRAFATGLLIFMAALTLATYALPQGFWTDLLEASAKAGFVGGIADWFAVTALFRHPLGLPIPHTAILPNQKVRLGGALGRFVANHVFTGPEVGRVLGELDIAGMFRRFLADPAATRPAAEAIARMLPRLLVTLEDGRARRLAQRIIPRILGGPGAGAVVARALRGLVEGGRHQEVFGFILGQFKTLLASREEALRAAIEERVREQGGRLVGWAMGATIARRVLSLVNAELDKMSPDGSELREAFDVWVRREIERMETDPARAAEIGAAIRKVVAHETIQSWLWDVWSRMRLALEADAARPHLPRGQRRSRARSANHGRDAGSRPCRPRARAVARREHRRPPAARRSGAIGRVHRRRGRRLGHRHHHRPAGALCRQGPAIRAA